MGLGPVCPTRSSYCWLGWGVGVDQGLLLWQASSKVGQAGAPGSSEDQGEAGLQTEHLGCSLGLRLPLLGTLTSKALAASRQVQESPLPGSAPPTPSPLAGKTMALLLGPTAGREVPSQACRGWSVPRAYSL